MPNTTRTTKATATQIRAAMFGLPVEGMQVVRQAWRTTESDSDEIVMIQARDGWWVARRISDRLDVWAYAGDVEAEDGFDQLLRSDVNRGRPWREAREAPVAI